MSRNKLSTLTLILFVFLLSSCSFTNEKEVFCSTDYSKPGIELIVKDAESGEIITSQVNGRLVDNFEVEEKMNVSGDHFFAGFERGTYSIVLEADNYKSWYKDGVELTEKPCMSEPMQITAEMQPLK